MKPTYEFHIDGHKLVALNLNTTPSSDPPIILLHGVTLSPHFWLTDPYFRTQKNPCYAITLPGHHPAQFPTPFYPEMFTPEMFAHLLGQVIQELVGEESIILVGHSTGGFAALILAATYPTQVHRLVSIAGFAQGKWQGFYGLQQRIARQGPLGRLIFRTLFRFSSPYRSIYRYAWRAFLADSQSFYHHPQHEQLIENGFSAFKHLDWQVMSYYFALMPDIDISSQLSQITAPTLVLIGDQDPTIPPTQAEHIAQHIPNSDLVIVKKTGHMLLIERPKDYVSLLKSWFDSK